MGRRRRRGFTDRLDLYNVSLVTVMTVITFIAVFLSGYLNITDMSALTVMIPSAYGELAIHTGFVIWKAKVENCRKHRNVNTIKELESDYG